MSSALERLGVFESKGPHCRFATRNEAFEWCENEILSETKAADPSSGADNLEDWLASELRSSEHARRLSKYFERRDVAAGTMLYAQGSPADTIDLVVTGTIAVTVTSEPGLAVLVRRISTRSVVGEMGFFRNVARTATVSAEGAATVYTLTKANYERLKAEDGELTTLFLEFIARTLSDRLEFATQGIAALS
jgi:CRP-like cAMP-binding protein